MFLVLNHLFSYSPFFRNELVKLVTEAEFLVTKVEVLVALATVLVAISSPVRCQCLPHSIVICGVDHYI